MTLDELMRDHPKLRRADIKWSDTSEIDRKLALLGDAYPSLKEMFKSDVNTVDEFESFVAVLRVVTLLRPLASRLEFIKRSSGKTPDLWAELNGKRVYFEVTLLKDQTISVPVENQRSTIELVRIVEDFRQSVEKKLKQAASVSGPFLLVIESQRDWNAGFVLEYVSPDLTQLLPIYQSVSALILLFPETLGIATKGRAVERHEGVLIQNPLASRPISDEIAVILEDTLNRGRREA